MTRPLRVLTGLPVRWANVLNRLRDASIAGDIMSGRDADDKDRDLATDRYVTAVDALVAELQELREAGVLDRISLFLVANAASADVAEVRHRRRAGP